MRVVDDDAHVVVRLGHDLEAARHERQGGDAVLDGVERHVERHGRGDRGEDVVGVGTADERRTQRQRAARRAHLEGEAVERERQRARADVRGRVDRVRDRALGDGGEGRAATVVEIA